MTDQNEQAEAMRSARHATLDKLAERVGALERVLATMIIEVTELQEKLEKTDGAAVQVASSSGIEER